MKIQTIGTGSMWNGYNSACYLIDNDIMVDFPNGACKYLFRRDKNPSNINHILLTHFHGDHYFDIPFYILKKAKDIQKNINIYCSKNGKNKIKKIGILAFPNSFKDACNSVNLKYHFEDNFTVNNYEVSKFLVDHGRMKPAYGYIFKSNDKYIGFTGDTSLCNSIEMMADKCNYLFCDCMFINGTNKHQGIDNLKYLSNKYPKCTFVVSHLDNETRKKIKLLDINNIIVPNDYDIIDIE